MNPTPCVPCCSVPQAVDIPGLDGNPGPSLVSAVTATTLTGILAGSAGLVTSLAIPLIVANGGTGYALPPIRNAFSPSDPTTTTSATLVMMGMGSTAQIIPATSGKVLVLITGMIRNSGAAGSETDAQLYYGTGSPPANGAAFTGTSAGAKKKMICSTPAGVQGFSLSTILTLTPATTYWLDVALAAVTGGVNAYIYDLDIVAIEL